MNPFKNIMVKPPRRSRKNLSHSSIRTDMYGRVTPINFEESAAGATHVINTKNYIVPRPLFAPAFAKIYVLTRTFYVPHRLNMANFEEYYAQTDDKIKKPYTTVKDLLSLAQQSGNDAYNPFINGSLGDFIGIPTVVKSGMQYNGESVTSSALAAACVQDNNTKFLSKQIDIMKLLAYHRVWCEWYADENYDFEKAFFEEMLEALPQMAHYPYIAFSDYCTFTINGQTYTVQPLSYLFQFHTACGPKDYFLGALPAQQAGSPIQTPLGSAAPVVMKTQNGQNFIAGANMLGGSGSNTNNTVRDYDPVTNPLGYWFTDNAGGQQLVNVFADLSNAVGGNVVEFRTALAAQRFEEKEMRGGKRYKERMRTLYNVDIPDGYVQRSQYVGGSVQDVSIDTIFSTAETDNQNSRSGLLGSYAGRAYSAGETGYKGYFAMEPGIMLTLQTIIPMPLYINGFKKDLIRKSFFENIIPDFVGVGEQPIEACEFAVPWGATSNWDPEHVFGFVPHYGDWCKHDDEVHGDFRGNLGYWHTAMSGSLYSATGQDELNSDILRQFDYVAGNRLFAVSPKSPNDWTDLPFICKCDITHKVVLPLPNNLTPAI